MSTSTLQLDRNIFNPALYTSILSLWYQHLPAGNPRGNAETAKQWWGLNRTADESSAYDELCREKYAHVLESISPEKYPLPEDTSDSRHIVGPFMQEIDSAETDKGKADILLAVTILLDQIPRNIYRDPAGLRLVYNHYDRLALTLIRSAPQTLLNHSSFRGAPAYKQWLALPVMHSENLQSQEDGKRYLEQCKKEAEENGDKETVEMLEQSIGFADSHLKIVERFGRFPHRNECLGRENVGEEGEWLKTGETFGVRQGQKE